MRENPTRFLKREAKSLGFLSCGISKAVFLEEEATKLENWLNDGKHGEMKYMENHFDMRLDPRKLVPGAKSVISLSYNYFNDNLQNDKDAPKISKYAYGNDYHVVIRKKLKILFKELKKKFGDINGRVFVDSAPVMEKPWAAKSGLGWIGKNTNLISQKIGSYYFLAEIIVDLEFEYDTPATDHCGSCTACIDSCPTGALDIPYQIDASKCISYLTIELRNEIPSDFNEKMDNWAFGCDVCQDVCPWNRFSRKHNEPLFNPNQEIMEMEKKDWEELTEETFEVIFKNSAVKRTKYKGLKRNISFIS
ncbi:MAG: tRNA epoxyqueuosine(34) reductase QueG [Flavobacteriaceae bacterium]|jgi:epoxyqueuosine reductase|nr:tRNA epoxyqueuosine(34) reductase QueG [Flavobacteriaceae bacterium]